MNKLTKTLDVSGCSDEAIANFERIAKLDQTQVQALLGNAVSIESLKARDEFVTRALNKTVELLERRNDYHHLFGFSPEAIASGIRQIAKDYNIEIKP